MIDLKCKNCGADLTTDEAQTTGKCPYCNSRFAIEKKIQKEHTSTQTLLTNEPTYTSTKTIPNYFKGKRPRFRIGLILLTLFINPFITFAYIIYISAKRKSWDIYNK